MKKNENKPVNEVKPVNEIKTQNGTVRTYASTERFAKLKGVLKRDH